ncbi:unnamed protein product [Cyclocybe aegerita]|uniref:Ricin B lectin domain-containing protein n=1 Tax=Cyclocybe aegerita TaxID=1973307 RepID=A0A8S0WGK6_CYCAE|nr:unnamed protein product [Cyclocybe aegerita]
MTQYGDTARRQSPLQLQRPASHPFLKPSNTMSTQRFALPPGVYYIQTTEATARNVANPSGDGQQLFVATPSGGAEQQWLISGNGIIRALNVNSGRFALTNLASSAVPQAVTRATSGVEWIINVEWDQGSNTFKGPILANDSSKRRFSLNGNNIELAAASSSQEWVFVAA